MIWRSKDREFLFLFIILLSALGVRFIFWRYGYLYGNDPYYHFSNYEDLVEYKHIIFPIGLYSPALGVNSFLKFLGVTSYDSFRITTPLFGVLTILIVYLLVKEIFTKNVALATAVILSFTPAFILRTIAGNYRGDPFSMFFVVLTFYLFILSIKRSGNPSYFTSLSGGTSLAFAGFVWSSGYIFSVIIISGFVLINGVKSFTFNENPKYINLKFVLLVGSSIFLIYLFDYLSFLANPKNFISGFVDFSILIFPGIIISLFFLEASRIRLINWDMNKRLLFIIFSGLISLIIFYFFIPETFDKIINLYRQNYVGREGSLGATAELLPVNSDIYLSKFQIGGLIFPIGIIYLLKNLEYRKANIFLLIWLIGAFYVMVKVGQRGTFIASIPISIFAGYGVVSLAGSINNFSQFTKKHRIGKMLLNILLIIISIQGIAYSMKLEPHINDYWYDALSWEKENLPEDSVILSRWTYGHWISSIGGGEPVVDPGQNQEKISQVVELFFETNRTDIEDFLVENEVDYFIMPSDIIGSLSYMMEISGSVNQGYVLLVYNGIFNIKGANLDNFQDALLVKTHENNEKSAIIYADRVYAANIHYKSDGRLKEGLINNNSENPVFQEGSFFLSYGDLLIDKITVDGVVYYDLDTYAIFIPEPMKNRLITSLLFFDGENTDGLFTLIYSNPEIKIYKANYEITKVAFFKSGEMEYNRGDSVELIGEIKTTSPFQGSIRVRVRDSERNDLFNETFEGVSGVYIPPIEFSIPEDSPLGKYSVSAILLDLDGNEIDKHDSEFSVVW